MKNLLLLSSMFFIILTVTAGAQGVAPPGAGDKTVGDRNIKDRQIELDRIEREAHKTNKNGQPTQAPPPVNFEEVKQDFESIQRLQAEIVETYQKAKTMDYAKISSSAEQMNKSGMRLEKNLFPPPVEDKKKKKKSKEEVPASEPVAPPAIPAQEIKTLIVELDHAIADFTSSPMFTNQQVVNAESTAKAQADLKKIISLSAALKVETDKAK